MRHKQLTRSGITILRLQTIVLIICCSSFFVNGQEAEGEWPVIVDPFPDSGEIGPEPPPTTPPPPDCSQVCQDKIDEANAIIASLQQQLADTNATLLARIISLEGSSSSGDVPLRVSALETYLPGNITTVNNKIDTDVAVLRDLLVGNITGTRLALETRIDGISTGGGDSGKAAEVYSNLTQRINFLENGKIQNLVTDNTLWRQNFKVVNSTFAKLRKSNWGNNVIVTG